MGAKAVQLAMAKHATEEQPSQKNGQTDLNGFHRVHVINRVSEDAQCECQQAHPRAAAIKSRRSKSDDERE